MWREGGRRHKLTTRGAERLFLDNDNDYDSDDYNYDDDSDDDYDGDHNHDDNVDSDSLILYQFMSIGAHLLLSALTGWKMNLKMAKSEFFFTSLIGTPSSLKSLWAIY